MRSPVPCSALLAAALTLLVGSSSLAAAPTPSGGCVTTAGVTTCHFVLTGAAEQWTVPSDVTSLTIHALGGGPV